MIQRIVYHVAGGAALMPTFLAIFGAAACIGLVVSILTNGPWLIFILFLIGAGWLAYNSFRVSHTVVVTDDRMEWKSFIASGSERLSDLKIVKSRYLGSLVIFEFSDKKQVRVPVTQGYMTFIHEIQAAYPGGAWGTPAYAKLVDNVTIGRRRRT